MMISSILLSQFGVINRSQSIWLLEGPVNIDSFMKKSIWDLANALGRSFQERNY